MNEPPRIDLYSGIHKALRACMAATLLEAGRLDTEDDTEVARLVDGVLDLARLCDAHAYHENTFIHPAIETRSPGASESLAIDHAAQEHTLATLRDLAAHLRECTGAERLEAAVDLYRALGLFVAEHFRHMQQEEDVANGILWFHYTDAELATIHQSLVGSIPAEEKMPTARWMLPAMSPAERLRVLGAMRACAPRPAFEAALRVIEPHIAPAAYRRLLRDLGQA